eukprot:g947.t1
MICKALVDNGSKVYVVSRKEEVCQRVADELSRVGPGSAVPLPANLNSDAACRELAAEISRREEKVDCLVNNAGITWGAPFLDFPDEAWGKVFTLNVATVFNLTRAFIPLLKRASRGNTDPSHVINIGSVAGNPTSAQVMDVAPSYAASKAAVNKVTQILAANLVKDHINVNCIAPAVFPSKMTYKHYLKSAETTEMAISMHPVGRVGSGEDMAGMVLFLASQASAFVTGSTLYLDGGLTAIHSSL